MSIIDADGQPTNAAFNHSRNIEKAVASLKGILEGVTADKHLNEHEANFLLEWTREHSHLGGDFVDIYEEVTKVMADSVISEDERVDLLQMLDDCIQYGKSSEDYLWRVNQFLGYLRGIAADGAITEAEFVSVISRLKANPEIAVEFPVNILISEINRIVSDGTVTPEELRQFCELITQTTGANFVEEGNAIGGSIALFNNPIDFDLSGATVCFTGKFHMGNRTDLQTVAVHRGMSIHKAVRTDTDLVVVGTWGSRDWVQTSLGRKIQRAHELVVAGNEILITTEQRWLEKLAL